MLALQNKSTGYMDHKFLDPNIVKLGKELQLEMDMI